MQKVDIKTVVYLRICPDNSLISTLMSKMSQIEAPIGFPPDEDDQSAVTLLSQIQSKTSIGICQQVFLLSALRNSNSLMCGMDKRSKN